MSTILPWFSENMTDLSRKLAEFEDDMQAKLRDEIAVQTSFKNLYIQEKAKTSRVAAVVNKSRVYGKSCPTSMSASSQRWPILI
jgi:hypothetical protein